MPTLAVGARQADREAGDLIEIGPGGERSLLRMHAQDRQPPLAVGPIDQHLAVEAAGVQQRRVEDLGPVGGGQQHHADAAVEAVQLDQQLVQRLLAFVVAAEARRGAARLAQGIELVDEDDRRRAPSEAWIEDGLTAAESVIVYPSDSVAEGRQVEAVRGPAWAHPAVSRPPARRPDCATLGAALAVRIGAAGFDGEGP